MVSKTAIQIFVIILLLALIIAVYINGKHLNTDKCVITFKSSPMLDSWQGLEMRNESAKVIDLYSNLSTGRCLVKWDRAIGYVKS